MKNTGKRIISALLVAIMFIGIAPVESLTGLDFGGLFGVKASAASISTNRKSITGVKPNVWTYIITEKDTVATVHINKSTTKGFYEFVARCLGNYQSYGNYFKIEVQRKDGDTWIDRGSIKSYMRSDRSLGRLFKSEEFFEKDARFLRENAIQFSKSNKLYRIRLVPIFSDQGVWSIVYDEEINTLYNGNYVDVKLESSGKIGGCIGSVTASSSNIKTTSATLKATAKIKTDYYGSHKVKTIGVQYGTSKDKLNKTYTVSSNKTSDTYSKSITGLKSNKKYYYRAYALYTDGHTEYSSINSFKTAKPKPSKPTIIDVARNVIKKITGHKAPAKYAMARAAAPSMIVKVSTHDVGIGDNVTVDWNSVEYAEWYKISINDQALPQKIYGTTNTLTLTDVGINSIRVRACNTAGDSAWSDPAQVEVHPDVNIEFMVGDEEIGFNEYQANTLTWGHDLEVLPETPVRKGCAFRGWFTTESNQKTPSSFDEIKDDLTAYSSYAPSRYKVRFLDAKSGAYLPVNLPDGTTATEQTVEYSKKAIEPTDLSFVPEGYHFVGWDKAFDRVIENMTIIAVTDFDNYDLPVLLTNVSAERNEFGYEVHCTVNNRIHENTRGRIIVALKTEDGKLITTTESAAYFIRENGSKEIEVFTPNYDAGLEKNITADVAEVYAVADFKSTVPVGEPISVAIEDRDPWTQWLTDDDFNNLPQSEKTACLNAEEVEEMTQYHSRDWVERVTTDEDEYAGMLADNWHEEESKQKTETTYSSWTTSRPTPGKNQTVEEKDVAAVTQTYYWYKRYTYYNKAKKATYHSYSSTWATNQGYSGSWEYKKTTSQLSYLKTVDGIPEYEGVWFKADCNGQSAHTTFKQTVTVTAAHKEYRLKTVTTTHYMGKWNDEWSAWTTTPIANEDNKLDVETQVLHRYKAHQMTHIADTTGYLRTDFLQGNVDASFAGKQATLFIYKINEASDWTTEYLAQTTIDENGHYSFEAKNDAGQIIRSWYKLREEPSITTGDFTVTLGIEGSNSAIYLGKIEAPKPIYTVTYVYPVNGEGDKYALVGEPQVVVEGGDAEVPNAPVIEGMTFQYWDMRSTNITQDTEIRAVYSKNTYFVSFIDWINQAYRTVIVEHGDQLEVPADMELNDTATMRAIGWDKLLDGATEVTENMVVTALYEEKTFDVKVYDGMIHSGDSEMDIIADLTDIPYGAIPVVQEVDETKNRAAEEQDDPFVFPLPEIPDTEDVVFLGTWIVSSINGEILQEDVIPADIEITEDTYLTPQYQFLNTASVPTASVESGSYTSAQTVTLESDDGAVIYYTLDGSDPADEENDAVIEYTAPITITSTCTLRALACKFNCNNSDEATFVYAINDGSSPAQHVVTYAPYEIDLPLMKILVNEGAKLDYSTLPASEGYTFDSAFCNIQISEEDEGEVAFSDPWNFAADTVTEDVTLYLNYTANTYTVTFLDYDGFVLDEQEVSYGASAEAPEDPTRDGYVFTGWDTEAFEYVTGDLEVNAVYVPESEYARVSLNKSKYTATQGTSFRLTAEVTGNLENPTLIWSSSDENVAIVDDDGTVTTTGKGTADITVQIENSIEYAVCKLTVLPDPNAELMLRSNSYLTMDDYGFIRGFTVYTDEELNHFAPTVAEVKSEFANSDLVFVSADGTMLTDDDHIGTGTVIRLMDGDQELDSVTVIISGDLDGNGYITTHDASLILQAVVQKIVLTDLQIAAADVNGSGSVNNPDASMILRYLVGKETL